MINSRNSLITAKQIPIEHNVSIRVLDARTGQVLQSHTGHNSATNSLLLGIGYYLNGEGVLNQGSGMLSNYIPQYISLGTMGLHGQTADENGLPIDIGNAASGSSEVEQYQDYMNKRPGFGADGYDANANNGRSYFGLGLPYTDYVSTQFYALGDRVTNEGVLYECNSIDTVTGQFDPTKWTVIQDLSSDGFEIFTPAFLRSKISYRNVVPEQYAETANTIDIVFSAMISTGALAQFRGDNDYILITEAGLWSTPQYIKSGENGLLAGYRIVPPDESNWDMSADANRTILQNNILRVGRNQVVQVIWKMQLSDSGLKTSFEEEDQIYAELRQHKWGT